MCLSVCLHVIGADGRDDARRLNEQLVSELNAAQDDMKRLRQAIDQMAREYEAAKDVDVFRRYGKLKRAVKRTVMHIKLHQHNHDEQNSVSSVAGGSGGASKSRSREEFRRRVDNINSKYTCFGSIHFTSVECKHFRTTRQ